MSAKTSLIASLCALFAKTLERPSFAPSQSFFASGGDSLGATALLSDIAEEHGVELKLRELLENPSPERLALAILKVRATTSGKNLAAQIADLSEEDAERMVVMLAGGGAAE